MKHPEEDLFPMESFTEDSEDESYFQFGWDRLRDMAGRTKLPIYGRKDKDGLPNFIHTSAADRINNALAHIPGSRAGLVALLPRHLQPGGLKPFYQPYSNTAYLDALRGWAALIVCNHHEFRWEHKFWQMPVIASFVHSRAVGIFFIVSGYVLTRKLLLYTRRQQDVDFLHYLASATLRRYVRLYLSGVFAAFVTMALLQLGVTEDPEKYIPSLSAQLSDWIKDTMRFTNPFGEVRSYWNPTSPQSHYHGCLWTIPVEFRGSMLVFAFCIAAHRMSPGRRTFACWLLIFLSFYIWATPYAALFLFGLHLADRAVTRDEAAAELQRFEKLPPIEPQQDSERRLYISLGAVLIGLAVATQPLYVGDETSNMWMLLSKAIPSWWGKSLLLRDHFWQTISAALVVWGFERCKPLQRPLSGVVSQYIGTLGFGIYIMQVPVAACCWLTSFRDSVTETVGPGTFLAEAVDYFIFMFVLLWAADFYARADRRLGFVSRWVESKAFAKGPINIHLTIN